LIQDRKRFMVHMNKPYEEQIRTFNLKLTHSKEVTEKVQAKKR